MMEEIDCSVESDIGNDFVPFFIYSLNVTSLSMDCDVTDDVHCISTYNFNIRSFCFLVNSEDLVV